MFLNKDTEKDRLFGVFVFVIVVKITFLYDSSSFKRFVMDTMEKTTQILELCKKLSYKQRIIFSDEGNLTSPSQIMERPQESCAANKPNGLWYSFGPAWVCYLTNEYKDHGQTWEKKRLAFMTHIYKIVLNKSLVYCIENEKQFDEFVCNYGNKNESKIRWNKVADHGWHGIEIRFMQGRDYGWYEGWDCSSGCIWHPNAIKNIETIKSWRPNWELEQNESSFSAKTV